MKHWVFAFIVVVGVAWLYQDRIPGDLFDDPVAKRQSAHYELSVAEKRLELHDENRERLVEIETQELLADNPNLSRAEAKEMAEEWIAWEREQLVSDVEGARDWLNQLQ